MINQPMPGLTPEAADKRYLKTTGGTMTGELNMGVHRIIALDDPGSIPLHAVNLRRLCVQEKSSETSFSVSTSAANSAVIFTTENGTIKIYAAQTAYNKSYFSFPVYFTCSDTSSRFVYCRTNGKSRGFLFYVGSNDSSVRAVEITSSKGSINVPSSGMVCVIAAAITPE